MNEPEPTEDALGKQSEVRGNRIRAMRDAVRELGLKRRQYGDRKKMINAAAQKLAEKPGRIEWAYNNLAPEWCDEIWGKEDGGPDQQDAAGVRTALTTPEKIRERYEWALQVLLKSEQEPTKEGIQRVLNLRGRTWIVGSYCRENPDFAMKLVDG